MGKTVMSIRVSKETRELWNEVLYEMKKKGYSADYVLKLALQCLLTYYSKGAGGFRLV